MPILISTPEDLDSIRNNRSGDYELTNDIDMGNFGSFTPIGTSYSSTFSGSFDGKGYKIKNIQIGDHPYSSIFGYVKSANIKNVGVVDAIVEADTNNSIGTLIGYLNNIDSAYKIDTCYSSGSVSGQYHVGGLIGQIYAGDVNNCYSTATVNSLGRAGGLSGHIVTGTISNCYSTGQVTGDSYVGGLVGSKSNGITNNSYWDIETSGQTTSSGGTGKTTAEMKTQSTYTGWDLTNTWAINGDYPYLQVFGVPDAPAKIGQVTVNSFTLPIQSNISKSLKSVRETKTFLNTIQTVSDKFSATLREVRTYTIPIETAVEKSNKTVRRANENVNTFISPIAASVERKSKTFHNLLANIEPIAGNVNVSFPISNNMITGYAYVVENPSSIEMKENQSNTYQIHNPSYVEVIS
ncbi:GLUG motif-containing protein [Bacillus marinisedimentorum]|uniref:GLUG motif-containing protein n=1 Tax=Bacillus marinisedimentorum TaxID=1821260 RepID=UPI0007DF97D4|nr:GLUG motif-containing protein [Bacillus marinisedimentorum]